MKIAITGDTHNGKTSRELIQIMAERLFSTNPDIILHLGDIGETRVDENLINDCLEILNVDAAVLGNHDIWSSYNCKHNSLELWEKILPKLLKESGCHYLEHSNFVKEGVAIVGSYLHYDYSAQDYGGKAAQYIKSAFGPMLLDNYYEFFKNNINRDGDYLTKLPVDRVFAKLIGDKFISRLEDAELDKNIEHVVIITHVSCMPSQIARRPDDLRWSLGAPYFGNLSHVDFIKTLTKVRYIVSGHSHKGSEHTEIFDDGHEVKVINLDSDYNNLTFATLEI